MSKNYQNRGRFNKSCFKNRTVQLFASDGRPIWEVSWNHYATSN